MQRQDRYIVIKKSDIDKYITQEVREELEYLVDVINMSRAVDNKKRLEAVVVESDWPMYDGTWEQIENWVHELVVTGQIEDCEANRIKEPSKGGLPANMRT